MQNRYSTLTDILRVILRNSVLREVYVLRDYFELNIHTIGAQLGLKSWERYNNVSATESYKFVFIGLCLRAFNLSPGVFKYFSSRVYAPHRPVVQ